MSDITDLFSRVVPASDAEPSADTVDADLARGRVALVRDHRRRTIRRSMAATSTVAAAAVVVVIAAQLGGSSPHHAVSSTPTTGRVNVTPKVNKVKTKTVHHVKAPAIKLVDYTGQQLAGFTVDKVPDGWHLSTSTQYALLIDPQGDQDNDPDAFVGKLAVLTQSSDVHHLPNGTPVTVNGQAGVVTDQGKYGENLTYNSTEGGVVIQAPAALNWSDSQIVAFAEGVHETSDALQGRG